MANWHAIYLEFNPPVPASVLRQIQAAWKELDDDAPASALTPTGMATNRGVFAQWEGQHVRVASWRSPIAVPEFFALLAGHGVRGRGFLKRVDDPLLVGPEDWFDFSPAAPAAREVWISPEVGPG